MTRSPHSPPAADTGPTIVDHTITGTGVPESADRAPREMRSARRYVLIGERGRGGIGRVLEAFDRDLDRRVALKELHRVSASSEARFIREAKITARLEHPAIVPVHEVGRWQDGTPYYAMKLVAGRDLEQLIDACGSGDERLALIPNLIAVAEAIGYAHSEHIIHRDLKPANVIVGEHGETTVIDWGLAKDLASDDTTDDTLGPYRTGGSGALTVAGAVIGTPAYMAPEQARGESVDARADVYALGAMLYKALSGERPHDGATSEQILDRVRAGPPRPLTGVTPDIPAELAAIVAQAMARDPANRYPTARELAQDLRRYHTGQLVTAHDYKTTTLVRRWIRAHRLPVIVAAMAIAAMAVLATMSVARIVRAEHEVAEQSERNGRLHQRLNEAATEALMNEIAHDFIDNVVSDCPDPPPPRPER